MAMNRLQKERKLFRAEVFAYREQKQIVEIPTSGISWWLCCIPISLISINIILLWWIIN